MSQSSSSDRIWRYADVAWRIFPPLGIVLDLCAIIADVGREVAKRDQDSNGRS